MISKRLRRKVYRYKKKQEKLRRISLESSNNVESKDLWKIEQDQAVDSTCTSSISNYDVLNAKSIKLYSEEGTPQYQDTLLEESLKKRYKSIPVEDRLPVGPLEVADDSENENSDTTCSNTNLAKSIETSENDLVHAVKNQIRLPQIHDAVVVPIEESLPSILCVCENSNVCTRQCHEYILKARAERNDALMLLSHYRNMMESMEKEKQEIQKQMEARVEYIKHFWRDQVIEGSSRAGKILRAALIRK